MGGEIIKPTRLIDSKPNLLGLESSIVQSIKERGAGGTKLDQLGIQLVLGLGIGSICVIKDSKNYLAYGVVHPDSSYKDGRLVLAQIGKVTSNGFWTPDHLNPAKPDKLNLDELVSTASALSQLATVGDHSSPGFAGVADPRHLGSVMSTAISPSRAAKLVSAGDVNRQVHIADEWEQSRLMASIISKNTPDDIALLPIPITVRRPVTEIDPQPDLAIVFPRKLVDQDILDKKSILSPLTATQSGALELLQAMAYHEVVKYQAGDRFSRVVDSHR
ncbi:hypothetical protein KBD69_04360 [Candidatus Woesebacteria bacterium]|nr:hypothetical protein [Candidatus Woesebacteria bacterium]